MRARLQLRLAVWTIEQKAMMAWFSRGILWRFPADPSSLLLLLVQGGLSSVLFMLEVNNHARRANQPKNAKNPSSACGAEEAETNEFAVGPSLARQLEARKKDPGWTRS